jgi:hypothetical protein
MLLHEKLRRRIDMYILLAPSFYTITSYNLVTERDMYVNKYFVVGAYMRRGWKSVVTEQYVE